MGGLFNCSIDPDQILCFPAIDRGLHYSSGPLKGTLCINESLSLHLKQALMQLRDDENVPQSLDASAVYFYFRDLDSAGVKPLFISPADLCRDVAG